MHLMDSLPRTDVELGSVVSPGFLTNGERDIVTYNQHLRTKVFIPIHLDVLAVPSSSPEWRLGWLKEYDAMGIPRASGRKRAGSWTRSITRSLGCIRRRMRAGLTRRRSARWSSSATATAMTTRGDELRDR